MKTGEQVKLAKWVLDMLFSITFPTIHIKNNVDICSGSWNILIQVKMQILSKSANRLQNFEHANVALLRVEQLTTDVIALVGARRRRIQIVWRVHVLWIV